MLLFQREHPLEVSLSYIAEALRSSSDFRPWPSNMVVAASQAATVSMDATNVGQRGVRDDLLYVVPPPAAPPYVHYVWTQEWAQLIRDAMEAANVPQRSRDLVLVKLQGATSSATRCTFYT